MKPLFGTFPTARECPLNPRASLEATKPAFDAGEATAESLKAAAPKAPDPAAQTLKTATNALEAATPTEALKATAKPLETTSTKAPDSAAQALKTATAGYPKTSL